MKSSTIVLTALLMGLAGHASAGVILDLAGDKDSFGTGKPDGSTVSVLEILAPGGEDGDFDQWSLQIHDWTHSFVIPAGESIVGASLEIVTLDMEDDGEGDGAGGAPFDTLLFLDGVELVGAFDDVFTPPANAATQITPNSSLFDLSPFLGALADGNLAVRVDAFGGIRFDAISIDYAELTIITDGVAPEPTTISILVIGLAGMTLRRRPPWSRRESLTRTLSSP